MSTSFLNHITRTSFKKLRYHNTKSPPVLSHSIHCRISLLFTQPPAPTAEARREMFLSIPNLLISGVVEAAALSVIASLLRQFHRIHSTFILSARHLSLLPTWASMCGRRRRQTQSLQPVSFCTCRILGFGFRWRWNPFLVLSLAMLTVSDLILNSRWLALRPV